jgi:predicted porin
MEQTMIGVSSKEFGTLKMGRFTNSIGVYDYSVFEDSKFGTNASQASYGRHNSQIQFTSPTISGFTLSAVGANFANNKWGQGTQGWGFLNGVDYSVYSATGFSNFGAATLTYANGPLMAQFAKLQGFFNDKATRIGANYTLASGAKIYGGFYQQQGAVGTVLSDITTATFTDGKQLTAASATGTKLGTATGMAEHSATELGLLVPVGQFNLRAGWVRNSKDLAVGVTDGSTKAEKISFGAEYNLSKRTQVQIQKGSTKTRLTVANASAGGAGFTTGSMSFLGLQHSF